MHWALVVLVLLIIFYVPVTSLAQAEEPKAGADVEGKPEVAKLTNAEEITAFPGNTKAEEIPEHEGVPALAASEKKEVFLTIAEPDFPKYRKVLEMEATAYTHTGNPTFTGVYPRVGTIAVDPKVIPLGSTLWIEGYGYGIAEDTGGLIKGNIIDLFMDTEEECFQWGRRKVTVYILD